MCVGVLHPSVVVEANCFLNWCNCSCTLFPFPSYWDCVQEMFNTTMPKTSYQWSGSNGASSVAHHTVSQWLCLPQPLLVPILSQINPVHGPPPQAYFFRIHFNINLPCIPRFSKRYLSIRFCHKNYVCTSPLPCMWHVSHPSHSS